MPVPPQSQDTRWRKKWRRRKGKIKREGRGGEGRGGEGRGGEGRGGEGRGGEGRGEVDAAFSCFHSLASRPLPDFISQPFFLHS